MKAPKKIALSKLDKRIPIYGNTEYRNKKCPKESAEQKTIFNELRINQPSIAKLATHIKNEGKRTEAQINEDKQQGLNTGFSDVIIIGHPVMVCEVKREDMTMSSYTEDQESFLVAAIESGAFAFIALGHKGFFEALEEWKCMQTIKNG